MNSILRTLLVFVVLTAVGFAADDFAATKKKAEAGDAKAQFNLGLRYQKGVPYGFNKDADEAVKWYRLAADQGNAHAQYKLGEMYDEGDGVPKDYAEAVKWFRLAAEQGLFTAISSLSFMYISKVEASAKDEAEIDKWYRKAAEQGDADAQFEVGLMYFFGRRVTKDLVQAHMWLNIAGANGNRYANSNLLAVASEMTRDQKAEAMKLARELFAKLPKKK
jgi:TPR repeat protein